MLAKVERFNQIGEEMAAPDADFDALMDEMGKLQDEIDAANGVGPGLPALPGHGRAAVPRPRRAREHPFRRRASSRGPVPPASGSSPTCCCSTSPPTTWTPSRCSGSSSTCTRYPGAVLAVTHDRYFLDHVAEWICEVDRGQLFPYKGNYSTYLETKAARMAAQGQAQAKLAKRMERELRVGALSSPKARQAKSEGASGRLRRTWRPRPARRRSSTSRRSRFPPARVWARRCSWPKNLHKELRRPRAHRRPVLRAAPQRHRGRHRPQRRRQDHPLQDHRGPRAARRRRRSRSARR